MRYSSVNVLKGYTLQGPATSVTIPASQTAGVLTGNAAQEAFSIPGAMATNWRCDITISAATVATGINLKLQTRFSSDQAWQDSSGNISVANGFTGTKSINLNVQVTADQTYLPLRPQGRVVAVTGVGDSLTATAVYVPVCG